MQIPTPGVDEVSYSEQPPFLNFSGSGKGDAPTLQAAALEDVPRAEFCREDPTADSQRDLTVTFRNQGDGELLPGRWIRDSTPSEVAFGWIYQSRRERMCINALLFLFGVSFFCLVLFFFTVG